jgi:hypothetical protein
MDTKISMLPWFWICMKPTTLWSWYLYSTFRALVYICCIHLMNVCMLRYITHTSTSLSRIYTTIYNDILYVVQKTAEVASTHAHQQWHTGPPFLKGCHLVWPPPLRGCDCVSYQFVLVPCASYCACCFCGFVASCVRLYLGSQHHTGRLMI